MRAFFDPWRLATLLLAAVGAGLAWIVGLPLPILLGPMGENGARLGVTLQAVGLLAEAVFLEIMARRRALPLLDELKAKLDASRSVGVDPDGAAAGARDGDHRETGRSPHVRRAWR